MISQHLINTNNRIRVVANPYHLINSDDLAGRHQQFLLACKVTRLAEATLAYYTWTVKRFINFCYPLNITQAESVTSHHIRMFLADLQESKNNSASVHAYFRAVKRFFTWQVDEGLLQVSPFATIKTPRVEKKLIQPVTVEQLQKLLLFCDETTFIGARNKAIILMFTDTGLRLRELATLNLDQIDIDKETITVMGKGAKQRVVRIGLSCQKALLRYLYMRHDDQHCLWLNIWRKPITGDGIQQILKVLKVRAGITSRCSPHSLRHSFATMALINGAGEFEVQSLLGHSTLTMTRKYVQTLNSQAAIVAHKRWSPVDNLHLK